MAARYLNVPSIFVVSRALFFFCFQMICRYSFSKRMQQYRRSERLNKISCCNALKYSSRSGYFQKLQQQYPSPSPVPPPHPPEVCPLEPPCPSTMIIQTCLEMTLISPIISPPNPPPCSPPAKSIPVEPPHASKCILETFDGTVCAKGLLG
jgi:hypothetical protein